MREMKSLPIVEKPGLSNKTAKSKSYLKQGLSVAMVELIWSNLLALSKISAQYDLYI